MAIYATLIDKSPIVYKMLVHSLYYFDVHIQRFSSFEEGKPFIMQKTTDIIFMDLDPKIENRMDSIIKELPSIPFVLLHRNTQNMDIDFEKIPYRAKKPLDPKQIRNLLIQLVPKAGESKIHPFLKFPKTTSVPQPDTIHIATEGKASLDSPKDKVNITREGRIQVGKEKQIQQTGQVNQAQTYGHIQTEQKNHIYSKQEKQINKELAESSIIEKNQLQEKKQGYSIQTTPPNQDQQLQRQFKTHGQIQYPKGQEERLSLKKFQQKHTPMPKENLQTIQAIKNNENQLEQNKISIKQVSPSSITEQKTKISPVTMATRSSDEQNNISSGPLLTEKDILHVLNKYKDTLEFQEMMEKVLSDYAKGTVTKILQNDKVTDILQQPLNNFTESQNFKDLVKEQIIQYVHKHLPVAIKSIVEQEIQKILEG